MDEELNVEISLEQVRQLIGQVFGVSVDEVTKLNGYDDQNFLCHVIDSGAVSINGSLVVFKITNPIETAETNLLESINDAMIFCDRNNIEVPLPIPNLDEKLLKRITCTDGKVRTIRLLTFVPGRLFMEVSPSFDLLFQAGAFVGRFSLVFRNFESESLQKREFPWALEKCVDIRKNLNVIDLKWHESINHILDNFERFVLNEKSHLSTSIIHGDINEQNLIVRQHEMTEDQRLPNQFEFGLIDFSDVHLAPTVFDLAIFITYVLIVFFEVDGLKAAKHVVDGFQSVTSLTKYEQQVLPVCVKARLCQSLVLGAYAASLNPDNEYVLSTAKKGWPLLNELSKINDQQLEELWN